ncbi:hypothetical protein LX99_04835 [Mucilaginibacter oryzae]|uniref:Peptidase M4 n=1 Tax=Mucilaginibacter oryzae TaxID=468058 RepID=A0A316H0P2_9SPHI|nr:hypothetical protein [Mucilaginibacter oryzae]PWK68310.1 hypothetical protein LX99_04835 [Mucilaginibacter oryzae]
MSTSSQHIEKPVYRRLYGYAFDPSLSNRLDTAPLNHIVLKVQWDDYVAPGPVGKYIEVIDYDPASELFYPPVDLNDQSLLATDGIYPSESNPKFHQQMVYAIAMTTIQNFEKALGRPVVWNWNLGDPDKGKTYERLRIYPHGIRDANAYYHRDKGAILFGYFSVTTENTGRQMPNGLVFTCLSHDIITHEVTHAILDGIKPQLLENDNLDALAFHEAFSDLVALFQHFTFPEVLKSQIAETRGNLFNENILGQLATQFGEAIGKYGSLRDAIGKRDQVTGKWEPKIPDPREYESVDEAHERGSILVAAVFDAFIQVYKLKVADLIRINSNGTGILNPGELHPDLVKRLAKEASKVSQIVLNICIRALDYCPPVDLTFGDYLRAIITADFDLVKEDVYGYRLAFIEAFRKRGIYPVNVKSLSTESLRLHDEGLTLETPTAFTKLFVDFVRAENYYSDDKRQTRDLAGKFEKFFFAELRKLQKLSSVFETFKIDFERHTGLELSDLNDDGTGSTINIKPSVVFNKRVGPDGASVNQAVFSFCEVIKTPEANNGYNAGCTLIFDLNTARFIYIITKSKTDYHFTKKRENDKAKTADAKAKGYYIEHIDTSNLAGPIAALHQTDY